jgi:hypothetical protein
MARMKENPRYNVISLRLNDEELYFLKEVTRRDNKSIAEIIRAAINNEMTLDTVIKGGLTQL